MEQNNELYHYGIPGMKWGRRKAGYVTVRQANKNAKKAASTARKESIAKDKKNLSGVGSGRKMLNNANKAADKARQESIAKDKAHNKQLRAKKRKQNSSQSNEPQRTNATVQANKETVKMIAGNAAYVAGAAAASALLSKGVGAGKISAVTAKKIGAGANNVRNTLNFYQGVKIMNLRVKGAFGFDAVKGRDY